MLFDPFQIIISYHEIPWTLSPPFPGVDKKYSDSPTTRRLRWNQPPQCMDQGFFLTLPRVSIVYTMDCSMRKGTPKRTWRTWLFWCNPVFCLRRCWGVMIKHVYQIIQYIQCQLMCFGEAVLYVLIQIKWSSWHLNLLIEHQDVNEVQQFMLSSVNYLQLYLINSHQRNLTSLMSSTNWNKQIAITWSFHIRQHVFFGGVRLILPILSAQLFEIRWIRILSCPCWSCPVAKDPCQTT